jgi:Family of unknown function (DUF6286)
MRLLNRPLAFILAVALAAASVILIVEVIEFAVGSGPAIVHWPTWYHWAHTTRWNAQVIRVWSAILIVIGVLILALELKPRRITRMRLCSGDQATDVALTRSGLAGTLRAAATEIDGISRAEVTVRRRRAHVAARSAARGRAAVKMLKQPVTQAVGDRLSALDLQHPPRLKVHVNTRRR